MNCRRSRGLGSLLSVAAVLSAPVLVGQANDAVRLSLPIDCTLGTNCFLQNYVDIIPGKGHGDYICGRDTYDGHKGTDFRVLSTKAADKNNVAVLAAAPGRVRALRDGVIDQLMTTPKPGPALKGRECGNGVVIDHGAGWQTQYCHLLKGSVLLGKGDRVSRGQRIGAVGYSGAAAFAHLHISVRHNGKVIDPFLANPVGAACVNKPLGGLWDPALNSVLKYEHGQLIETGFAGAKVTPRLLEQGGALALTRTSDALVFFARYINLEKGDVVHLSLNGPEGFDVKNKTKPLQRAKAQYVAFVGKKRRAEAWPDGRYVGQVELIRAGQVIMRDRTVVTLGP